MTQLIASISGALAFAVRSGRRSAIASLGESQGVAQGGVDHNKLHRISKLNSLSAGSRLKIFVSRSRRQLVAAR